MLRNISCVHRYHASVRTEERIEDSIEVHSIYSTGIQMHVCISYRYGRAEEELSISIVLI